MTLVVRCRITETSGPALRLARASGVADPPILLARPAQAETGCDRGLFDVTGTIFRIGPGHHAAWVGTKTGNVDVQVLPAPPEIRAWLDRFDELQQ